MEIMNHWPVAATISWLVLGAWFIVQGRSAREPIPAGTGISPGRTALRRFMQSRAGLFGGAVFYLVVLGCLIGPWLVQITTGFTYDKTQFGGGLSRLPPAWWAWFGYAPARGTSFAPMVHLFGTDALGRDVFVRVLEGGRISIAIGIFTTLIVLSIGVIYGATAGYVGGRVDQAMMRFVDVLYALPYITLVIVIMALFGRNIFILFAAIGFVAWLTLARITRGEVLGLKKQEFVEAAVATGTSSWKIIVQHLIPNTLGPVVVYTTVVVPRVMLEEAFLSFFGFGIQPPRSSWGTMVGEGVMVMKYQPWLAIFPIAFLMISLYALNYLGDGVRDALDPRVRGFTGRRQRGVKIEPGKVGSMGARHALAVGNLSVEFDTDAGALRAVKDVSFELPPGETLAIVGESGSGKSVTVRALMGLNPTPPCIVTAGTVLLAGTDVLRIKPRELRRLRGDRIGMIFQDPMTALNPYHRIGNQLIEVLETHGKIPAREQRERCVAMLRRVGIPEASRRMRQYPHELSGGMRQRVMIAMALLGEPDVLIADEPTTALDVTIQAQILELLRTLQAELHMSIIFITHDLGIVGEMADRVAVMYAGRIVETGTVREVLKSPEHPYTRGLLGSLPRLDGGRQRLAVIPGEPPDLRGLPLGCAFAARCALVHEECGVAFPEARQYSATHTARCVKQEEETAV